METLISIIMSTYNEKKSWIRASVNSILEQTYTNFEFIIVVDNPDNLENIRLLEEYQLKDKRIKIIVNEKNLGLVKSLNIALKYCKGSYIARMDADDIADINRLDLQKKYLEENELDFVFSKMLLIDEDSNKIGETNNADLMHLQVKKELAITNISNHPTWFLKKEVYENLGGYRDVLYCEDYDFSLRSLAKDYRIGKVNRALLSYRMRSNGISQSNALEQYLNARGIRRIYNSNKIEDYELVAALIKRNKAQVNVSQKKRFNIASEYFRIASTLKKENKKTKAMFAILKSLFISKYSVMRIYDSINLKIKNI